MFDEDVGHFKRASIYTITLLSLLELLLGLFKRMLCYRHFVKCLNAQSCFCKFINLS